MRGAVLRTSASTVRNQDIIEWSRLNAADLKKLRNLRKAEDLGIVGWAKYFATSVTESRAARAKNKKEEKHEKALATKAEGGNEEAKAELQIIKDKRLSEAEKDPNYVDTGVQYYNSLPLLKRMKWKRVTWEKDADYEGFAQRIQENDAIFGKMPAMSHMCLQVVHDSRSPRIPMGNNSLDYERGSLTNWLLQERDAKPVEPFILYPSGSGLTSSAVKIVANGVTIPEGFVGRKAVIPAYSVDWQAGEARIADTISSQELVEFLTTVAPRLQAVQQRMDNEQAKLTEEIDEIRVRLGAYSIKYNKYDKTFWDDPARKKEPDTYVTPDDLNMFIQSCRKRSTVVRYYLTGGMSVRVLRPGQQYHIDFENKEVSIPANFADYNFVSAHSKWERLEKMFNFNRAIWFIYFACIMLVVGDLEVV